MDRNVPAASVISRTLASSKVIKEHNHKYAAIPSSERRTRDLHYSVDHLPEDHHVLLGEHLKQLEKRNKKKLVMVGLAALSAFAIFYFAVFGQSFPLNGSCDTIDRGYVCDSKISHTWGQYSPYYAVPSLISKSVPPQCQITFVNVLSRHGARNPTSGKTLKYEELVNRIHANATSYSSDYSFIQEYNYTLGVDDLSVFGQQQMVNSGIQFYQRYQILGRSITPFIRSSGSDRVIESAQNWTQGFHSSLIKDSRAISNTSFPYDMVIISEDDAANNTLSHARCTDFEEGFDSTISDSAQATWASIFTPSITARLNQNLPGLNFSTIDTIYFMDLCPFNTVADDLGTVSPFCNLFTESEWRDYDYYQSLGKYYGYGWGNPLGATQGVGFTNELIARMTTTAVQDHTSTNSTLDSNPATFPVGGTTALYADFTHDSDMTSIFSALGLYNATAPLLNTTYEDIAQTKGYSSAWTVPFAGRAYFEKMSCVGVDEELVRVVVNDRVVPLETCGGDEYGRCRLSSWVQSLSWARGGGDWDACFV